MASTDATRIRVADATDAARIRVAGALGSTRDMAKETAEQGVSKVVDLRSNLAARVGHDRSSPVDLAQLDDPSKLLYCRALVSLAQVDGTLDPREISNLYLFASTIGLAAPERNALRALLVDGPVLPEDAHPVRTADAAQDLFEPFDSDQRESIGTSLVRDLVRISRADQEATDDERLLIIEVATLVFPRSTEQIVVSAERMVATEEEFAAGKLTTSQFESRTKDIAAKLAAFGAPLAAVNLVGVSGLSAAGVTSGLATLGFGGILGLSSMVTGIGAAVLLGVGVYQGARYALGANERTRENRREHLMQQVIVKHQQAISELTDDISSLAGRMEEHLTQTGTNEERLSALTAELSAFRSALAELEASKQAFEAPGATA